jgi:hypothetical protein
VYVNPKEAQMNSARRLFAALAVVLALCVAPAAQATVDYSMNAAGGDYAPAAAPATGTAGGVDYSMNAAGGNYAPAVTPATDTAAPVATDSNFAWGAAALGAGAALAVVLLVTATRTRISTARSHREAA